MLRTELDEVSEAQSIDTLRALRPARLNNELSPSGQSSTRVPSAPVSLHTAKFIGLPEGMLGRQEDLARSTTVE